MTAQHKQLAAGQWSKMSFADQMANIGSEINRVVIWSQKSNKEYAQKALYRALELLDLSINQDVELSRRRELLRTKEGLVDHFVYDNVFNTTALEWQKYFDQFAMLSARRAAGLHNSRTY